MNNDLHIKEMVKTLQKLIWWHVYSDRSVFPKLNKKHEDVSQFTILVKTSVTDHCNCITNYGYSHNLQRNHKPEVLNTSFALS